MMTEARVKMLISYDVVAELQQAYYEFVLGEMIPTAQSMGLQLNEAWHTAYGEYPIRLNGFVAKDRATLDRILASAEWKSLEEKLKRFVTEYQRKIIPYREGFQF
ncbi:MAG TPA: hypothetical protein VJ508_09780 [Saprospiraceae bacterium]|nr:hypothetical protein [Saprospiraceae bacterium]